MNRENLNVLRERASAALSASGFECIEAEWNQHDRVLRFFIDHENGVDLDACVQANKILDENMDIDGDLPAGGTLEISSPGIERPLRLMHHFEKYVGSQVLVRLVDKVDGRRTATGRLIGAGPGDKVTVEVGGENWTFPLSLLHKATLVYEWQH